MQKLLIAVVAAAAFALPAHAKSAKTVSTQDFVQKVAVSDMFEVQSSGLAQTKSSNDAIKSFAQRMTTDHTKTSDQLKSMAGKVQGAQIPEQMDDAHLKMLDKLNRLSGAKFDAAYKADQVKGHEQAVRLFSDYAKNGDNADLKKWAQDTLPALQEHLKMARALPGDRHVSSR